MKLQEERNAALARHKEIMLFANGPGESESAEAREYFKIAQEEALIVARAKSVARRACSAPSDGADGGGDELLDLVGDDAIEAVVLP